VRADGFSASVVSRRILRNRKAIRGSNFNDQSSRRLMALVFPDFMDHILIIKRAPDGLLQQDCVG
jgi:hypothetical protein